MRILLDTQAFLWMVWGAPEFSSKAKRLIVDPENNLFLSLASIWEIAIKSSIGKLKIADPIESFIPAEMQENDIRGFLKNQNLECYQVRDIEPSLEDVFVTLTRLHAAEAEQVR